MGLRPKPRQEAMPPGPPPKGEALWNLSIGFVLRGGPTRTLIGHGRPSPENKPINGFEGPLPFAGFQGAEPLGGVSGRSPAPGHLTAAAIGVASPCATQENNIRVT